MTIYTFPSHKPFLHMLASHVQQRRAEDGGNAPKTWLLLPNRRACRALSDLLPAHAARIVSLGDVESVIPRICETNSGDDAPLAPIHPLKRRFMLAMLCMRADLDASTQHMTLPKALELADALAELLDEMQRQQIDMTQLETLAPDIYAAHWQRILHILHIITLHWPRILEEQGALDPVAMRNLILTQLAADWQKTPPPFRVVIAGSTASNQATSELMKVVAALPRGEVIVPALHPNVSEAIWASVSETHPHFFLKRFLESAQTEHAPSLKEKTGARAIEVLDDVNVQESCPPARMQLMEQMFWPADHIHQWHTMKHDARALHAVEIHTYQSIQQEAEAVAIRCQQMFAASQQSAAPNICIVSNHPRLTRHITLALARRGMVADASEGRTLAETPWMQLMRLLVLAALDLDHPGNMLALLKHPYVSLGMDREEMLQAVRAAEQHVLRRDVFAPNIAAIVKHLQALDKPLAVKAAEVLAVYSTTIAPFAEACRKFAIPFVAMLNMHVAVAETLTTDGTGVCALWQDAQNEPAKLWVAALAEHGNTLGAMDPETYPALLLQLANREPAAQEPHAAPSVRILPSEEARLETADMMMIVGMNETVWPKAIAANPWMSRQMQRALGLYMPETHVSRSAHDLWMLAHAPSLVFTRAVEEDGVETVESRWLQRLRACTQDSGITHMQVQHLLPEAECPKPEAFVQPTPTPPLAVRPTRFSLTDLELLQRDPYSIYAKYILRLEPLEPIGETSAQRLFGNMVHAMLEDYVKKTPLLFKADGDSKAHAASVLIAATLSRYVESPPQRLLWQPKLEAILSWVMAEDVKRAGDIVHITAEMPLHAMLAGEHGVYAIRGKADRVETYRDGRHVVIDYKTGAVPKQKDVAANIACQLPLECWMLNSLSRREMAGVRASTTFEFWDIKSNANGSKIISAPKQIKDVDDFIAKSAEHITSVLDGFMSETAPYTATPDRARAPKYHRYLQLERYDEWG